MFPWSGKVPYVRHHVLDPSFSILAIKVLCFNNELTYAVGAECGGAYLLVVVCNVEPCQVVLLRYEAVVVLLSLFQPRNILAEETAFEGDASLNGLQVVQPLFCKLFPVVCCPAVGEHKQKGQLWR